MALSLDQARAALAAQPFSRPLGAQLNSFGPERVPEFVQRHPAQHLGGTGLLGPSWAAPPS